MKEDQHTEFKRIWKDEYLQYISGFANAQGGTLYIGIDDDGQVCGINNATKLLADLPNQINQTTGVLAQVDLHTEDGKEYISICVDATEQPVAYRGKFYYRSGSTLQEVKGSGLQTLILKKMGRTWDDMECEGAKLDEIDPKAIDYFLRHAIPIDRMPKEAMDDPVEVVLKNLNLMTEDGHLKNAAILLFGKNPQRRFINARFRIGRFVKDETDLVHQDNIEGNILQMADEVMWKLRQDYLIRPIHYEGMHRVEPLEMPEDALRELVYNAIIHRDYLGQDIQMKIYNDRIWFWNDGNLPEGFSVERMSKEHMSVRRNPLIANIFYRAGFIESWGRGVTKVCQSFKEAGLPEPGFENFMSGTLVTIHRDLNIYGNITEQTGNVTKSVTDNVTKKHINNTNTDDYASIGNVTKNVTKTITKTSNGKVTKQVTIVLNGYALMIVEMIERNPKVTTAQMAETIGIAKKNLIALTNNLQRDGIIRRVGSNRGGHWEIIDNNQ